MEVDRVSDSAHDNVHHFLINVNLWLHEQGVNDDGNLE
jgi:hypothetical protein